MKKILVTCALAITSVGLYTGAFGEDKSYVHEDYSAVVAENFQDTLPGRKKDTTNRKPMPTDTVRRDSGFAYLLPVGK
jgi:hypothetical protein